MKNQNTSQNVVAQDSSRAVELLQLHFKSSSSTKTAFSFLKVLAILFAASAIWSNLAESQLQIVFPIVAFLYFVFVGGQIIIKENDSRLKNTNTLAKTLQVVVIQNSKLEEELASYKQAFQNSKQVILEWEQAHAYLKAENSNLNNNFSNLQGMYDSVNGRLSIAEKNAARYKKEIDDSEKIIKKAKNEAYVLAIKEYDEYTYLNRSIPQQKDETKKAFDKARQEELEARINKAKAMSEVSS